MLSSFEIAVCNSKEEWDEALIDISGSRRIDLCFDRLKIQQYGKDKKITIPLSLKFYSFPKRKTVSVLKVLITTINSFLPLWRNNLVVSGGFQGSSLFFSNSISDAERILMFRKYFEYIRNLHQRTPLLTTNVIRFYVSKNDLQLIDLLKMEGFKMTGILQTPIVDLNLGSEKLWNQINKKTRNAIRQGLKRGVQIRESTSISELETYFKLKAKKVSERDKIFYYQRLCQGLTKLFIAEVDGRPTAAAIISIRGKTVEYIAGALQRDFQWYRSMDVLLWHVIKWGIEKGYAELNLCGADPEGSPLYSITKFKLGFSSWVRDIIIFQIIDTYSLGMRLLWVDTISNSLQRFLLKYNCLRSLISNLIR